MTSVAYVTTTFPTLASFIESEVRRLHARGVRVRVFTLRPLGRDYQPEHAALVSLTRPIGSPFHPAGWLALLGWLVRRPHVLVPEVLRMLWASRASLYALAGHAGYLPAAARVASALERESLDRVHGAWAHFPASVAYLAARLTGRRFSMAAHAGADLYRTRAFLAEKVRAAEFVVGCVRGNVEMLRALGGPASRVEWLYHGVDLERFDAAGRERSPAPELLCVGRLSPAKGFDDAVRAFAELGRRGIVARLTVVGDGPERPALERLAHELGVAERVEFVGALTHQALLPLYRRAWLLLAPCRVLPNGRRDGIPNVVVEAMAMAVPCAGTRAAGLEEVIVPGETGTLVPPDDPGALAAALEPLLRDPSALDAMGRRARARVLRDFDAARNFERLAALLAGSGADAPVEPARVAVAKAAAS
ncbi:MAG TPA: glycosyltransferase [Candidatus Limnocylindria bacterium]|nr:glycosyltransferase [Candidatus Limnocylindria bacterium]